MSYIGQGLPADTFQGFTTDSFTGDGSATTFTLSKEPFSEDTLIVVINNVIQKPTTNFTVSGTTLTIVGTAVASGDVIYAIHTGGVLPITTASAVAEGTTIDLNGGSDKLILDADADTTISADTDDQIDFKVGGTDRLTVQSTSGNNVVVADGLTLTDGNITFSGSGHGIHLGVTSANAANLLDDYEEGDFAVTTTYAQSGSWGLATSSDTLHYIKVGKLVSVQGLLILNAHSSASGICYIDLPFTPSNQTENGDYAVATIQVVNATKNSNTFTAYAQPNLARLYFDTIDATSLGNAALAAWDADTIITISIVYHST